MCVPTCTVGKLIKSFGDGWETEVPSILKTDMKSLTQQDDGNASGLSMQQVTPDAFGLRMGTLVTCCAMDSSKQRVISSGLDSIKSKDAQWITELFSLMGCFAEVKREDIVVKLSMCLYHYGG